MIIFPRDSSVNVAVLIVCLSANSTSSYRDAENVAKIAHKRWGARCQTTILTDKKFNCNFVSNSVLLKNGSHMLQEVSQFVKTHSPSRDILFVLSGHGYQRREKVKGSELDGKDEYIRVGRDIVLDDNLTLALFEHMHISCHSLSLIDTCHSGTMLDMPWQSKNGFAFVRTKGARLQPYISCNSYCISACQDSELAGEDISNFGGFGGKLVSQFLDYFKNDCIDIVKFFIAVKKTFESQSVQRSSPVLSRG